MRYFRTAAFKSLYRKLPSSRQEAADKALRGLDEAFASGRPTGGLGLKALRHGVWEIRAGLLDRIVFCRTQDLIEFLVIGNHDEIRKFLKGL